MSRKKSNMQKNLITLMSLLLLAFTLTACPGRATTTSEARVMTDREGHTITVPTQINTIVTLGPSNTEVLVALGFADKIIATDRFAAGVAGLGANVPRDFGFMDFDVEYIIDLMPDIIFVTGMTRVHGDDDPMAPISAVGITIIYKPTSVSLAAIMEDIRFIADVMGVKNTGETIISNMRTEINAIRQIAASITETRTVYFEISPAPWMVSFGRGTFLNEMIELVGATNIFADHDGWMGVSEEVLLELNPDVILTSVDFLVDPIAEIKERPGFNALAAVQNNAVFPIDTAASNRPTHNVIIALRQIAESVFPEYFK